MFIHSKKPLNEFFPFKFPKLKLQIRHGGDPFIASQNIFPRKDLNAEKLNKQRRSFMLFLIATCFLVLALTGYAFCFKISELFDAEKSDFDSKK